MADKKISALTGAATPLAGTEVLPIVQSGATVKVAVSDLTAGRAVSALSFSALSSSQEIATFAHSSTSTSANNGGAIIQVRNTSNTNGNMQSLLFRNSNDTASSGIFGYNANQSTNEGFLTFGTRNSAGTFNENMRLDSSGNLTISNNNLVIGTSGKGIDFSATSGTGTSELLADYEEGTCAVTITALTGTFTATTINSQTYTKIGRAVFMQVKFKIDTIGTAADGFQISSLPFLASPGNAFALPGKNISNEATFNGYVELYGDTMRFAVALVNTHTYLITATFFV